MTDTLNSATTRPLGLSMASRLGYAQRIDRDGFAIVEDVLSRRDVEELRRAVAAIPLGEEVRKKRGTYGIRNLLQVCPRVRQLAALAEIRSLVMPALGEMGFAVRAVFFDKVPDANWKLGWHQDNVIAVANRQETPGFVAWSRKVGVWQVQPPADVLAKMLAIRVHLDDCDAENGPLRVLPGSHCHGWLDDEMDQWKQRTCAVSCHVQAGGVVAMRPLLIHASAAAARPGHRRVIHIEFACDELPGKLEWHERIMPRD